MTTMGLAECSIFPNADLNGELSLSQQSSSSSSFRQRDAASASTVRRHRKQRYTRSRTGCLTCRQRKVRCDQVGDCNDSYLHKNRPLCENCQSLDREVGPDEVAAYHSAYGGIPLRQMQRTAKDGVDRENTTLLNQLHKSPQRRAIPSGQQSDSAMGHRQTSQCQAVPL